MPPYKPYVSRQQEKWAHTPSGRAALGNDVEGKDKASKGLDLPPRTAPKKKQKGYTHE